MKKMEKNKQNKTKRQILIYSTIFGNRSETIPPIHSFIFQFLNTSRFLQVLQYIQLTFMVTVIITANRFIFFLFSNIFFFCPSQLPFLSPSYNKSNQRNGKA